MSLARRIYMLTILAVFAATAVGLHSATVSLPSEMAGAAEPVRHIFLTLTDGSEMVQPGGSLVYVIQIRSDAQRVEQVDVTLTLPSYANLIEISDNGVREGNTVVWRNFSLDPVVARRLMVDVSVDPQAQIGGVMSSLVTCDGESAADTTRIGGSRLVVNPPELRLRITDGKDYAGPDEELRYVLTVENTSESDRTFELRTELPNLITFLAATGQYQEQDGSVRWMDQLIRAGDVRTFELIATVQHDVVDFAAMVTKASIDGFPASDTTVAQRQPIIEGFSISVTDALQNIAPASEVIYQIHLRNEDDRLATGVGVSAALPLYVEFMEASNGGVWTGNNVRWDNLTVSPHGDRTLTVLGHVRTDAPINAVLRMTAETQGLVGVDQTTVTAGAPQREEHKTQATLRKIADRSEVRPGDTVTYTISLRNNTDQSFRNVRIEDRLDARYMTAVGAERGQMQGDRLLWILPELQPGQEWTTRYSVEISDRTPNGISIDNVVTAVGDGLESLSLTERVFSARIGVVRGLPPTGAAFDAIFLAISGLAGIGQTFLFKRRLV